MLVNNLLSHGPLVKGLSRCCPGTLTFKSTRFQRGSWVPNMNIMRQFGVAHEILQILFISDDIGRLDYIACCRGCTIATVKNILTPKNTPKPWRTNWSYYWWKALLKTGKISIHCLYCASVVISIVHHALPCLHRMNLCLSHLGTWKVCCKVRC